MTLPLQNVSAATVGMTRLRWLVFQRDQFRCVAPDIDDEAGPCFDQFGFPIHVNGDGSYRGIETSLTLQHVTAPWGQRRRDESAWMLTLCWGHHLGAGPNHGFVWATTKRALQLQRDHLQSLYGEEQGG